MKHDYYPFRGSEDFLSFTFESISEQRIVRKRAEFAEMSDGLYNFGFGDLNNQNDVDDLVVTDNKDTGMVLATLIQILVVFLETHSGKAVHFKGSTCSRTRMYQIILTKEKASWENKLTVYGIVNGDIMPFEIDFKFDAFIVKQKLS